MALTRTGVELFEGLPIRLGRNKARARLTVPQAEKKATTLSRIAGGNLRPRWASHHAKHPDSAIRDRREAAKGFWVD